ncbi:syndecan-4-like [Limanda limanda]|uniref:syndecan-4-like n=1 Tax=Limanda limanda TaxID=27771 RepID=UPI0029C888A2|nr:syndecan-4-like [Limanda limanda]
MVHVTSRCADVTAEPRCTSSPNNFSRGSTSHRASRGAEVRPREPREPRPGLLRTASLHFTSPLSPHTSVLCSPLRHFTRAGRSSLGVKMRNPWLLFLVALATGIISENKLLVSSQSPASTTDDMYLEGRTSGDLPIDDEDREDDGSGSGSGDYAFIDILDKEKLLERFLNFSKIPVSNETVPVQPEPTADSTPIPPTTATDGHVPSATRMTTPLPEEEEEEGLIVPIVDNDYSTDHIAPSHGSPTETTTTKFSIDISVTKDGEEDNSLDTSWDIFQEGSDNILIKVEEDNEVRADGRRRSNVQATPEEVTSENLWERTDVLSAVIACGVVGFLCAVFLLLLLAYRMKKKDEGSYDLGDTKVTSTAYHQAPTKEFYA